MSLRLSRICLGIMFVILESMIVTWDLLMLGIGALLTGGIVALVPWGQDHLLTSSIVFLIMSIGLRTTFQLYGRKLFQKNSLGSPLSIDKLVGSTLPAIHIHSKLAVYYDGAYRPIANANEVSAGELVHVIALENNTVKVKKI